MDFAYLTFRLTAGSALCAVTLLIVCSCGCAPLSVAPAHNPRDIKETILTPEFEWSEIESDGETDVRPVAFEEEIQPDQSISGSRQSASFTIPQIIALARTNHPIAIASNRKIRHAKAQVAVAGKKDNPEFVIDVETPLHDKNDATELSTRVTFPLFQSHARRSRIRVARAEVATAVASHQAELRRLSENALLTALRVAYLQEKVTLDEQSDQLARERMRLLSPELRDGDLAQNLIDFNNATSDARQSGQELFGSRRDLSVAQVSLAEAMGFDLAGEFESDVAIDVNDSLGAIPLALPPRSEVIAAVLRDSQELVTAQSAIQKAWLEQELSRDDPLGAEAGPLYQDRLGRDDDTIGVRFQSDLPIHRKQRERMIVAGLRALGTEDQVQLKRHEIASSIARDYQELKSIAEQIRRDRLDTFVADQEQILLDVEAQNVMTGEQIIRIRQSILDRRRDQLDLEYRFTMLRSKLRLHAVVDATY